MEGVELAVFITGGVSLLTAFVIFIVKFIILYRRKQLQNSQEQEKLKTEFQQELLRSQMEIQEQTFNAISMEIHDNVGQLLSLAKVQVSIIAQTEITNKPVLTELSENIGKAMTDLRYMARSLNSDHLKLLGLKELISPELDRIQRSGIVATALTEEGPPRQIDQQKKLILFRIIQEALQNVIKHAGATRLNVALAYLDAVVEIKITDNGKGFDVAAVTATDGLGLHNMMARARLLKGEAAIESGPAKGTTVLITVPYD